MTERAAGVWIALSILLAVGGSPSPTGAQPVQGKSHVGGKPSGLVALHAAMSSGQNELAVRTAAEVNSEEPFVIPAGTALVVTDVYATGVGGPAGPRYVAACVGAVCDTQAPIQLFFDTSQQISHSLSLTGGVVFRAPPLVSCFAGSVGPCQVWLYGYLAKDK
jgi:hypothetical protein